MGLDEDIRPDQASPGIVRHYERMHDPLIAMLRGIRNDIAIQWDQDSKYIYNAEPLINGNGINTRIIRDLIVSGKPILDFDRRNVALLMETGKCIARWCPMVWTETLQDWCGRKDESTIDVLHIGTMSPHRAHVIDEIEKSGIKVSHYDRVYGEESKHLMLSAKVLLNIHREGMYQAQEQLRIAWALCSGCVVVSEKSIGPSIPEPFITEFDGDAPQKVRAGLESQSMLGEWIKFSECLREETWDRL